MPPKHEVTKLHQNIFVMSWSVGRRIGVLVLWWQKIVFLNVIVLEHK